MSSFEIGKLAQVIHVTGELDAADAWYQDVFGGEQFYRGYSPYEMRDASLLAIGDFVIEPMAPAATEGADQMPVGRFFHRFGAHLHSIAVNVKGIPELCEHLQANDIRVVGPGGSDPKNQERDDVQSIYTHPKDTHCLIEFVDFGGEVMAQSPRLDPDWDADRWRTEHPLGFSGASHITVLVRDLERATGFFGGVLGSRVFHEAATTLHLAAGGVSPTRKTLPGLVTATRPESNNLDFFKRRADVFRPSGIADSPVIVNHAQQIGFRLISDVKPTLKRRTGGVQNPGISILVDTRMFIRKFHFTIKSVASQVHQSTATFKDPCLESLVHGPRPVFRMGANN